MNYETAIANIITTDYSQLAITIETKDENDVLALEIVEGLTEKLALPPKFKIKNTNHELFDNLDSFVLNEIKSVDLNKCTKQQLLEKLLSLQAMFS